MYVDGKYGAEVRIGEITQGATELYKPPFDSQDHDANAGICRTIQPYLSIISVGSGLRIAES